MQTEGQTPHISATTPTKTDTEALNAAAEAIEEQRLLRRLQLMMNLVMQTVAQDSSLTVDAASQLIADARSAALAMFPGKDLAYDLIWRPRFQRLMRERFRIN
jgi:ligand-binding sensor domain-containing protein